MALRLPCLPLKPVNIALGCLYFSDGSQKCLAAFMVWIGMCLASQVNGNVGNLANPLVQTTVGALLRINVVLRGSTGHSDQVDNTIARIVKQNVDAKVQPVSSLAWCSILRSLSQGNVSIGLDAAMARYNSHPEVVAFEAQGGAGGAISLDNRKKQVGPLVVS